MYGATLPDHVRTCVLHVTSSFRSHVTYRGNVVSADVRRRSCMRAARACVDVGRARARSGRRARMHAAMRAHACAAHLSAATYSSVASGRAHAHASRHCRADRVRTHGPRTTRTTCTMRACATVAPPVARANCVTMTTAMLLHAMRHMHAICATCARSTVTPLPHFFLRARACYVHACTFVHVTMHARHGLLFIC